MLLPKRKHYIPEPKFSDLHDKKTYEKDQEDIYNYMRKTNKTLDINNDDNFVKRISTVSDIQNAIENIEKSCEEFKDKYIIPFGVDVSNKLIDFLVKEKGAILTEVNSNALDIFKSLAQDSYNSIEDDFILNKIKEPYFSLVTNGTFNLWAGSRDLKINWQVVRSFEYIPHDFIGSYTRTFIIIPKSDYSLLQQMFSDLIKHMLSTNIMDEELDPVEVNVANFSKENYIITDEFETLFKDIQNFLNNKEFYTKNKLPYKRGALLIGPPGNGKTFSFQYIINEFKIPLIVPQELGSIKYYVKDTFASAKKASELTGKPCLIFMEELNVVLASPGGREVLLTHLDGIADFGSYYFIGTTNKPEDIDQAILNRPSRIDLVLEIPSPNENIRFNYLKKYFVGWSDTELKEAALLTANFSFAYLKNLYEEYVMEKGDQLYDQIHLKKMAKKAKSHMKLDANLMKVSNKKEKSLGFNYDDD